MGTVKTRILLIRLRNRSQVLAAAGRKPLVFSSSRRQVTQMSDGGAMATLPTTTITAVRNLRDVDVGTLNAYLRGRGMLISDGYGPLKGETFRIAHMGDVTEGEMSDLLEAISEFLEE